MHPYEPPKTLTDIDQRLLDIYLLHVSANAKLERIAHLLSYGVGAFFVLAVIIIYRLAK